MALLIFLRLHCLRDYAHWDRKFYFQFWHYYTCSQFRWKKIPAKSKFLKLFKKFVILIPINFPIIDKFPLIGVMLLSQLWKKSWRTLVRADLGSTFCLFELMSGRTNVLTPLQLQLQLSWELRLALLSNSPTNQKSSWTTTLITVSNPYYAYNFYYNF